MENIDGSFYMNGCAPDSPDRLHTIDDLIRLIKKIGFIPLFSNAIPGYSVEEHTTPASWWCDNPETDPWIWRQTLSVHPDIAYGKFFNRNAGFISREWFPVIANYRRNGYDFDALYDDELAPVRAKKIMDAFEPDDNSVGLELMSTEIWEKTPKDEKTLTDLQMQTYLIISDFRQRRNKKGQLYGWHLSVCETPETKWGRDYIASGYYMDPMESWKAILAQIRLFYPDADELELRRLLGIKWPGVTVPVIKKKEKVRLPKEWVIPANPKYYDIGHAFDIANEIDWKQGSGIKTGDTVYVYVAAPVSAILYRCEVTETDIPYDYADDNLTIKALMKIRLLHCYEPDRFTFEVLKEEYGVNAIRGPRGIPDSLSEALNE